MPRSADRPGDPDALIRLLWEPDARVGRSGLTVSAITDAAISLADSEGLGAVTMRRLAEVVQVGAMTLYGYVPGRPELIELMLDRVSTQTYAGRSAPGDQPGWRPGLEVVAWRTYDEAVEHPWVTDLPAARPILGPGVCERYELELTPLDGIGLADTEMDAVLQSISGLALRAARWQVGLDRVRRESALTDEEWWRRHQPTLDRAMGAMDLPISRRVGETMSSAGEPRTMLETGLQHLLDGLALRLETRA